MVNKSTKAKLYKGFCTWLALVTTNRDSCFANSKCLLDMLLALMWKTMVEKRRQWVPDSDLIYTAVNQEQLHWSQWGQIPWTSQAAYGTRTTTFYSPDPGIHWGLNWSWCNLEQPRDCSTSLRLLEYAPLWPFTLLQSTKRPGAEACIGNGVSHIQPDLHQRTL